MLIVTPLIFLLGLVNFTGAGVLSASLITKQIEKQKYVETH